MSPIRYTKGDATNPKGDGVKYLNAAQREALEAYKSNGGGYPHGFAIPGVTAGEYAQWFREFCPAGWHIIALFWGGDKKTLPTGSFCIGQYRVRTGDPESPIYLCPNQ